MELPTGNAFAAKAGLSVSRGDPDEARRHILRALEVWEDQGNALVIAGLLDEKTLERAWSEGRAMSLDEALAYAREEP